jgi:hypothetical protein
MLSIAPAATIVPMAAAMALSLQSLILAAPLNILPLVLG